MAMVHEGFVLHRTGEPGMGQLCLVLKASNICFKTVGALRCGVQKPVLLRRDKHSDT